MLGTWSRWASTVALNGSTPAVSLPTWHLRLGLTTVTVFHKRCWRSDQ